MSLKYSNRSQRTAIFHCSLMVLLLLSVIATSASCNSNGNPATTNNQISQTQPITTQTNNQNLSLDIVIQKVFPKVGFRLLLVVTDKNGQFIKYNGTADAKIWIQKRDQNYVYVVPAKKEKMIYEWLDVEVIQEGYMTYEDSSGYVAEGIPIVLEWGTFSLISDQGINIEEDALCTIGIILTLQDGTVLTAEEENIAIMMRFTCC